VYYQTPENGDYPMTPEQYQIEASRTESMIEGIEGYGKSRLIHGILGLTSESGEIADTLKRWLYYSQPLDEDNLKEEIGDLLWYVALICNTLEIQMSDCMESNIRKLQKRFPEKFDKELAKEENRDRKSEMEAVTQEKTAECKFKVGQVWENVNGDKLQITSVTSSMVYNDIPQPIEAINEDGKYRNYSVDGYFGLTKDSINSMNLIKLISGPVEEKETTFTHLNGFEEGLQVAKDIADMLDGQDRKQALNMIEQRRIAFLERGQD